MSDSEEGEAPALSPEAREALQEFYIDLEQEKLKLKMLIENNDIEDVNFQENWQLSQFWYNDKTTKELTDEICRICQGSEKIALISCPTLFKPLTRKDGNNLEVHLLEYDRRFEAFGASFHFYDFNNPLEVPREFSGYFDLVVADPPFLSQDCVTKTAVTIKFLTKSKIILCTGAVMEELVEKLLNVKKTDFQPEHQNNLANEFRCYTNYESFINREDSNEI